jgi:hypothetical protein
MDVIIVPQEHTSSRAGVIHATEASVDPPRRVKSSGGLYGLVKWLADIECDIRILAWLPSDGVESIAFASRILKRMKNDFRCELTLCMELSRVSLRRIQWLKTLNVSDVILLDNLPLESALRQRKLKLVERLPGQCGSSAAKPKRSSEGCPGLQVWLQPPEPGYWYPTLSLYTNRGLILKNVEVSPVGGSLGPEVPRTTVSTKGEAIPCHLFEHAISVTWNEEMLCCPRCAEYENGYICSMVDVRPQDAILKKGSFRNEVGVMDVCRSCTVWGRHSWPNDTVRELSVLMKRGQDEAALVPGVDMQVDLTLRSAEEQESELALFDVRLKAWVKEMSDMGETPQGSPSNDT